MDKNFSDLNTQYQEALKSKSQEKQVELLEKMRSNIWERNDQNDSFMRTLDTKSYSIQSSSYQDLLEINGEMNRVASSQKLTKVSAQARSSQTSKNKYGPNNPYPQE